MKNSIVLSFFILVLCLSCENKERMHLPILKMASFDTIYKNNTQKMLPVDLTVYGINIKDSLDLTSKNKFSDSSLIDNNMTSPNNDSLLVFIDDKIEFYSPELTTSEQFPSAPAPPSEVNNFYNLDSIFKVYSEKHNTFLAKRSRQHYETFPLFVFNNSNENRIVEYNVLNGDVFAIQEAQNSNGEWKPIEYVEIHKACGNGLNFNLKSKHFLVSAVKKYSGDFQTNLRVKFYSLGNVYYSNVYKGSINKTQFNTNEVLEQLKLRYKESTPQYKSKLQLAFLNY